MQNKKIAIMVAMDKELATFQTYLSNVMKTEDGKRLIIQGNLGNNEIILAKGGIGKTAAGSFVTTIIERYHPDYVINMGIAGGYDRKLKPLDIVIATAALYYDVDMTSDEFSKVQYGQLEEMPLLFKSSQELLDFVETTGTTINFGYIATGDQFVTDYQHVNEIVKKHFSDLPIVAFDMESAAILHVCYLHQIPCLIVRSISDIIGSTNAIDYEVFSKTASQKASELVKKMLTL